MAEQRNSQVAALPVRRRKGGSLEVLLITSRDTGRWIVPKGWRMANVEEPMAASVEAFEEAGVAGKIQAKPIGQYSYLKDRREPTDVSVYLLRVATEKKRWPEAGQRRRKWFSIAKAAELASDKGLRKIIRRLGRGK